MKEVKSIDLVLEKCEVIPIAKEHIGSFHCKDIITAIAGTASNSILKSNI